MSTVSRLSDSVLPHYSESQWIGFYLFCCIKLSDMTYAHNWNSLLSKGLIGSVWSECLCPSHIGGLKSQTKVMVFGGGALGRWLGHREGPSSTGLVPFEKSSEKYCSPFPRGHSKKAPPSMNQKSKFLVFFLELPVSSTMRNKYLLFVSHKSIVFCSSSPNGLRQLVKSLNIVSSPRKYT